VSSTYSPADIAERYGIDHAKVLNWIAAGALRAVNVATNPSGRPRWRISEEALAEFEQSRANVKPVKPTRRRKPEIERRFY